MADYNLTHTGEQIDKALNYLIESTGDSTDRTAEIQDALNTHGSVKLGTGVFHITGIVMQDNSSLYGSGERTRLFLKESVTNGSAVTLGRNCSVSEMIISGVPDNSEIDVSSEIIGTRNGILFEDINGLANVKCKVNNCRIFGFSGSAIKCNNTGMYDTGVLCSNCIIYNCGAGVNIEYYSEYSGFVNIFVSACHYGCIDNGGNNYFSNCSFLANTIGLLMDNEDGTKTNCSHGSFVNCAFNHSGNNAGYAIKAIGMTNGEMFVGCNIFYGIVYILACKGFVFDGCNINNGTTVTIKEESSVIFSSCVFNNSAQNTSITDGSAVYFKNCKNINGESFEAYRENLLNSAATKQDLSDAGLTITWNKTNAPKLHSSRTLEMWEAVVNGTPTNDLIAANLVVDTTSLHGFEVGKKYRVEIESPVFSVKFGAYFRVNGNWVIADERTDSFTFTVPNGATGLILRVSINAPASSGYIYDNVKVRVGVYA